MSEGITGFFSDFFAGLMAPIKLFLKWCNWMGFVVFGSIYTIVKFTWDGLALLYDHILGMGALYAETGQVLNGHAMTATATFLTTVNTFFPLDLVIAMFSILIQLWIFWNIYRLIRSWIPTLS